MTDGAGLPAALAPVAEVLALAQSFALCIVTGPRDHRDSVYLRLTNALAQEFELVRHRFDRDGLEFFDVLTGGDGARPRVVFMSGLESMSDASRKETIVRLNLLRDSWAPHPARVILWIPAWGLGEFRTLAPDLFHWRSCLVPLHDADLPVRSETEYLVWACERYRSAHGIEDLTQQEVGVFDRLLTDRRAVHVGFGASERAHLLRALTRTLAKRRLEAVQATADLDIVKPGHPAARRDDVARVPVWLDAADMAGRIGGPLGWSSVLRAAGAPIADLTDGFWTGLSERAALVVFLDGFDRLDLRPGGSAAQLVTWLANDNPGIVIAAFIATHDPPPIFAQWIRCERMQSSADDAPVVDPTNAADEPLVTLLATIVEPGELHRLALYLFGEPIAEQVPRAGSPRDSAVSFVVALRRSGLIDASLFEQLAELRPRHAREIDAVAQQYRVRA